MPLENDSLFEHKLNEEGILRLRQILTITRWLLIIGLVQVGVFIADSILRVMTTQALNQGDNVYVVLMLYFYPAYAALFAIFFITYLVNFFRYARRSHESIAKQDSGMFNRSYKFLLTAIRMAVIVEVLNLIIWLIFFIVELGYYKNLPQ